MVVGRLILYVDAFWANAWDCGPYVALREKGLEFATVVALVREGAGVTPPVRHQAITGLEPALQHGDFWIAESLAIIEYLEDAFPPPAWPRLWPAELYARARARQIMSWTRMELNDLRDERDSTLLFYPPANPLPPLGPRAATQAANLGMVVERLVGGGGHAGSAGGTGANAPRGIDGTLFGEWCIADVDVAFAVMRLVHGGDPVPDRVRAYAEAVWRRPSVREYVQHTRPPHAPRPLPR
jgi:glutathione S-transferase